MFSLQRWHAPRDGGTKLPGALMGQQVVSWLVWAQGRWGEMGGHLVEESMEED